MKNRRIVFAVIVLNIVVGEFIYLISGNHSIPFQHWILSFIPSAFGDLRMEVPNWMIHSLPDALWMVAFMLAMLLIWDFRLHVKSIFWLALAFAAGLFFEIGQAFHWIRGTFDITDLILMTIGGLLPFMFTFLIPTVCKTK